MGLLSTFYVYNSLEKENNSSSAVDSEHDRIAQQETVYETSMRCQIEKISRQEDYIKMNEHEILSKNVLYFYSIKNLIK